MFPAFASLPIAAQAAFAVAVPEFTRLSNLQSLHWLTDPDRANAPFGDSYEVKRILRDLDNPNAFYVDIDSRQEFIDRPNPLRFASFSKLSRDHGVFKFKTGHPLFYALFENGAEGKKLSGLGLGVEFDERPGYPQVSVPVLGQPAIVIARYTEPLPPAQWQDILNRGMLVSSADEAFPKGSQQEAVLLDLLREHARLRELTIQLSEMTLIVPDEYQQLVEDIKTCMNTLRRLATRIKSDRFNRSEGEQYAAIHHLDYPIFRVIVDTIHRAPDVLRARAQDYAAQDPTASSSILALLDQPGDGEHRSGLSRLIDYEPRLTDSQRAELLEVAEDLETDGTTRQDMAAMLVGGALAPIEEA